MKRGPLLREVGPIRIIPRMLCKLRTSDWFHPDGFPLAVERRDPQEPFGPHTHEFSELVIVTGGRALHVTGRERDQPH